jgi:VWFA-related protein
VLRLLIATIALAACAHAAPDHPFVDMNRAELLKAAPELGALEFDSDQSALGPLLRAAGQQLESMLARFINVSIAEDVHEMRFESKRLIWKEHRDQFRYVIETRPFLESRNQAPNPQSGFLVAGRFMDMLSDLLPANQSNARFRYLGRIREGGAPNVVVAFVQREGSRQGLVWIDEATKRIVRLRTDSSFTRDIRFVPVHFPALEITLWLPCSVTVHARFAAGELHTVHRFSDYRTPRKDIGETASPAALADDPFEVLLKGVEALEAGSAGDAIAPLLAASGALAARIEPGYYFGLALYETHDLAGAETQFRDAVKRAPAFAAAHNELGAVLFERGDRAGAIAEFQEALRLQPGNPKMLANLDQATKEPADLNLGFGLPFTVASDLNVQVNVRQVLVPVVVTDRDGHPMSGLAQSDFKIFEDGVEQKIIAFTSERADISAPAIPSATPSRTLTLSAPASPTPLPTRRTYVICLDMIHASFSNFVHVREALQKLFREEQRGDSQYLVIALGRTIQVVQNTTTDPAKVLETLSGAEFKKIYQQSQQGSSESEISVYEGKLQEIRSACDAGDITCGIQKQMLPHEAQMLADHERYRSTQFSKQFRAVVEQVARGNSRCTLVLVSDGFPLAPGAVPFGLLQAYFPEFRSTQAMEGDGMQEVMEPIFRRAAKANVPVYTIDSRGLYTQPAFDASRSANVSVATQVTMALNNIAMDQGQTLSQIAAATGGKAFQNSNDLLAGLKKAFADGREYYMLAYVPTNEAQDGKFRKIDVTVRDNKATVSAKRGYWAPPQ